MNTSDSVSLPPVKPRSGLVRILLVEDNEGDARLIRELLSEAGGGDFEITHVSRLTDALVWIEERGFDVIMLDLGLPDTQGIDTAIRIVESSPDTPLIVLTGLDDEETGVLAVQEGAQDYLIKGNVSPALLRRSIHYAIQRQDMLTHLSKAFWDAKASEANLRNVLSRSVDGIVIADLERVVRFVNAAAEELYGKTSKQLVGEKTPLPFEVDQVKRVAVERDGAEPVEVEMRAHSVEWSGKPAYLLWLRQ
jgi:DNA-binding response OmpR family regulator